MPDANVWINPVSPPGAVDSMIASIDNDNNSASELFTIENDGGGLTRRQFIVNESGQVRVFGPIESTGTMQMNCQFALGDPVAFLSAGTEVARIDDNGLGDFSTGGINLPVVTSTPNGSRTGTQGDLITWNDSGTYRLMVSAGGTTWTRA